MSDVFTTLVGINDTIADLRKKLAAAEARATAAERKRDEAVLQWAATEARAEMVEKRLLDALARATAAEARLAAAVEVMRELADQAADEAGCLPPMEYWDAIGRARAFMEQQG